MKKLELKKMEKINGGDKCSRILGRMAREFRRNGDSDRWYDLASKSMDHC